MAGYSQNVRPPGAVRRKASHSVALWTAIWYQMAGKAMLPQVRAPYMVGAGHIAQAKTLQAQPRVGLLPALIQGF